MDRDDSQEDRAELIRQMNMNHLIDMVVSVGIQFGLFSTIWFLLVLLFKLTVRSGW